jgi:hypothetical protein
LSSSFGFRKTDIVFTHLSPFNLPCPHHIPNIHSVLIEENLIDSFALLVNLSHHIYQRKHKNIAPPFCYPMRLRRHLDCCIYIITQDRKAPDVLTKNYQNNQHQIFFHKTKIEIIFEKTMIC